MKALFLPLATRFPTLPLALPPSVLNVAEDLFAPLDAQKSAENVWKILRDSCLRETVLRLSQRNSNFLNPFAYHVGHAS